MARAAKKTEESKPEEQLAEVTENQGVLVPIKVTRVDTRKEDFKKLLDSLASELPAELIKTRKQGGAELSYLEWFTVADLLDDKVGDWECYITSIEIVGDSLVTRVALTIDGVCRENVGIEKLNTDSYGDSASNSFSMAFKRCAALFGIGRFLYHKDFTEDNGGEDAPAAKRPANRATAPAKATPAATPARSDGKLNARLMGMKKLGKYDVMEVEVPSLKLKWPINQFFNRDFDYGDLMMAVNAGSNPQFPFPCLVGSVAKNAKGYDEIGAYYPAEKAKAAGAAAPTDTAPSSVDPSEEEDPF